MKAQEDGNTADLFSTVAKLTGTCSNLTPAKELHRLRTSQSAFKTPPRVYHDTTQSTALCGTCTVHFGLKPFSAETEHPLTLCGHRCWRTAACPQSSPLAWLGGASCIAPPPSFPSCLPRTRTQLVRKRSSWRDNGTKVIGRHHNAMVTLQFCTNESDVNCCVF